MTEKKNDFLDEKESRNKTELANRIAEQSQKVANTYRSMESGLFRIFRWFSGFFDRIIFNQKYSKVVALVLAVLLYAVYNYNTMVASYTSTLRYARPLNNVPVTARYNTDTFELSGLPATANITITGDASNVTNALTSGGSVIANLEGLTEGQHDVKLSGEGFGDNVTVVVDPSTVRVVLKKKTTRQFDLSYDFINQTGMESIYSIGTPEFEYTKINVRASKDTLDSIAFVKALIDVSGKADNFEQDARLVAYNAAGYPVEADIVPETVHVTVPVTSPNKTVPIEVQVSGEIPDGKAIASITTDQQSVTIYGSETVLSGIDRVIVTLNAATISKDSTILRPIVLPTGVNSSNINQITMSITLGEGVTKEITGIPINYRNNVHNYKASQPDNKTTTSVTVFGTKENVDAVVIGDINVYVDMKDAQPGLQQFQLQVDQPTGGLVRYSLNESLYELNVLGDGNQDSDNSTGTESNND
ncbi:MAG: hypothetical protein IKG53_10260 [Solobacterium sp.]|nr:hypothetical protein [Solobacterium sp.]